MNPDHRKPMSVLDSIRAPFKAAAQVEESEEEVAPSHLLRRIRVESVRARALFEYASGIPEKKRLEEGAGRYDERAVQFAVTIQDLKNWPKGEDGMAEISRDIRIKAGEVIAGLNVGSMPPKDLDGLLGPQSAACRTAALQTAVLREQLRKTWGEKGGKSDLIEKLNEQDAATYGAVLAEGRERASYYALSESQKEQVEKAYGQAMRNRQYQTAYHFGVSLQASPFQTMREWGDECVKSFVKTAQEAEPEQAAKMVLDMGSQASFSMTAEGRKIAYDLVTNGKIQELAKNDKLYLASVALFGQWAEEHRKSESLEAGGDLHLKSLEQSLEIAQEGVEDRRKEQSVPDGSEGASALSKLPQRNVSMEAGHHALLSCHARMIRHVAAAGEDTAAWTKEADLAVDQAFTDEAPDAVLNLVSDLAESPSPQAHKLAAEIVRKKAFLEQFGTKMTMVPMMLDQEVPDLTPEEQVKYEKDLMSRADRLPFQLMPGEEHAAAVFAICEANLRTSQPMLFTHEEITVSAKVMHELGDQEEALRGLDLLCKQGTAKQAKELAEALLEPEGAASLGAVYEAEFQTDNELATELVRQARVIRTLHAYHPDTLESKTTQLIKSAKKELDAAIGRNEFDVAVQFGEVYEATLSTEQIQDEVRSYGNMADGLMTRSRDLLASAKAGEAGFDDQVKESLAAFNSALNVGSRNRVLNERVLNEAKEMRAQLVKKLLDPSAMEVDSESDATRLQNAVAGDLTMLRLANDLNGSIERAEKIQDILVAAAKKVEGKKHLKAEELQKSEVNRFIGELNTRCQDVRTYCYTSGADGSSGDHERMSTLAKGATVAAQRAYTDFCNADFSRWDPEGTHLKGLKNIKGQWNQAAGGTTPFDLFQGDRDLVSDAVYNDIHRLENWDPGSAAAKAFIEQKVAYYAAPAVQLKKEIGLLPSFREEVKEGTSEQDLKLREMWESVEGSPAEKDLAYKQACQEKCAGTNAWKAAEAASKAAVKVFAMKAGYLMEERMYQLMPDEDRHQWTAQDSSLFPGATTKTRPDIVQSFDEKHKVLLDLTAQKSAGHIFKKTNAWVHPGVTSAIEITYPSLGRDALRQCMLHGTKLDLRAIEAAEKRQEVKQGAKALRNAVVELLTADEYEEKMVKVDVEGVNDVNAAMEQLNKWLGSSEGTEPTADAIRMLQHLKGVAKETALDQHAQGEVVGEVLDVYLPPTAREAQKIGRELLQCEDAEDKVSDLKVNLVRDQKEMATQKLTEKVSVLEEQVSKAAPKKIVTRNSPQGKLNDFKEQLEKRLNLEKQVAELQAKADQIPTLTNQKAAAWDASLNDVKTAQEAVALEKFLKNPLGKRTAGVSAKGNEVAKKQKV